MAKGARVVWIDYAKVIGIFLVVLGHAYPWPDTQLSVKSIIYQFHMPLFFFVSGALHKSSGFIANAASAWRRMLLPAALWMLIYLYVSFIFETRSGNISLLIVLTNLSVDTFSKIARGEPTFPCFVIWYCIALTWCRLIFSALHNKLHQHVIRWIFFLLALLCIADYVPYFFFGHALLALPFYVSGFFSTSACICSRRADMQALLIIALVSLVCICMWNLYVPYGITNMATMSFGNYLPFKLNWAAGYIVGAVGIIFSVAVCKILASKRFAFITEMSNATFVILCSHLLLLIIGSKLCSIILPDNTGDVKYWLNAFITTIAGGVLYIVLKRTQLYALIGYQ